MGEVNADQLGKPVRELSPRWRNFWRVFRASALLFLWDAPAAVFCYWLPNSTLSLAQALILSQPPIRRALGIVPKSGSAKSNKANTIEFVDSTPPDMTGKTSSNRGLSLRHKRKMGKRRK